MIRDISRLLKQKLEPIYGANNIITQLQGLTRVKTVVNGESVWKVPFSVDCQDEDADLCESCTEPIFELVPDSGKRCIVYFENGRVNSNPLKGLSPSFTANVSLICWFDSSMFEPSENLTTVLIALFSNKLKQKYLFNGTDIIQGLEILAITPNDYNEDIFQRYTYNDFRRSFLGCPHGYFKLDINLKFIVNETCLPTTTTVLVADCC